MIAADRVSPTSAAEAAAVIVKAVREGLGVVPHGSGTRLNWLPPPAAPHLVLETAAMASPLEILGENLTASFQAGITVGEIDQHLAELGLWWPVDVDPGETLGGVVAAAAGDWPGRTGYGPLRDWVLGLELVTAHGQVLSLGGKTMKNVAGYDLVRLVVGGWGTLGLITAVTLRLLPRPEEQRVMTLSLQSPSVPDGVREAVSACELVSEGLVDWRLLIRLDGRRAQVERRVQLLNRLLGPTSEMPVPRVGEIQAREAHRRGALPWRIRVAVPPSTSGEAGVALRKASPLSVIAGAPLLGLFSVWTDEGAPGAVFDAARRLGGASWVVGAPRPITPHYSALEVAVREQMAPGGCFNPHR